MEVVIAFVIIVVVLALLDFSALKWGKSERKSGWVNGDYDVRSEWQNKHL
jgi:hypothetical protein